MKFEQLPIHAHLKEALNKIGYETLTDVQEAVIPKLLQKEDLIVQSKTGSGKTAAYVIPLIEQIDWDKRYPQVLVLSPTRELAMQIKEDFDAIGVYKRIRCTAIFGKQPYKFQIQDLQQKCHVVSGTPGRIMDHIERGTLHLEEVQYVVIDEADEMLKMGFLDIVEAILKSIPQAYHTCMFSATMPQEMKDLASTYMKDAKTIFLQQEITQIKQTFIKVKEKQKEELLLKVLVKEEKDSVIIFARTKEKVDTITQRLKAYDMLAEAIHGGLLQEERMENLKNFRLGNIRILVATDVAARGLDIEEVSFILNYDLPDQAKTYIHRVGRSGRMEKKGEAISFVCFHDQDVMDEIETTQTTHWIDAKAFDDVEDQAIVFSPYQKQKQRKQEKHAEVKKEMTKLYINAGKSKKMRAKDIVGAICEIEGIQGEDIGVIQIQEHQSYVHILHGKGAIVYNALQKKTIKGKKVKIEYAKE